ncbi:DUF2059 domain-containing protein [Cereibacter azotoformans]|uniref:Uncharacterized protein DUF2059 n=1 Tax=Cereibacter azotoformans TaxID=43057 RepID=A0A2T5JPV3_9RHOB|nr:DUF2059 domain-containing protein [Cereibacter azotoformans]AXQ95688.1 DUF2059 domain-containing protein [Cereibacter sphaeroides]PTR09687.1 uncharacterized protein DUF2059 [Cereibacter azotoformans]UIJ32816.1 DUF2059 domain-containing protein [Cereibacter azotoformans]
MVLPSSLIRLVLLLGVAVAPVPLIAQTAPVPGPQGEAVVAPAVQVAALEEALRIGDVIAIMREEGLEYGTSLESELFPERGGARWRAVVGLIYDTATMRKRFDTAFEEEIGADTEAIGQMLDFFGSEKGQHILRLEIEARRALLDEAAEEAAKVAVENMSAKNDPRLELLREFAEANDLIELNVAGALNSNLAFYRGLVEGAAFDQPMGEGDMLADVWSQEAEVRRETEEWLFPYLTLAYGPLSDEDLRAYIDFSQSPAGRKLNGATFRAFDVVFSSISRDLGRAAARQMQGEDI